MHPQSTEPQTRLTFDSFAGIEPVDLDGAATENEIANAITEALSIDGFQVDDVTLRFEPNGTTVTVYDDGAPLGTVTITAPEPKPDLRQRYAAELRRIADDIVTQQLPLGSYMTMGFGVLSSRADLERWAAHFGSAIQVEGSNGIPWTESTVRLDDTGYGPELRMQAQIQREDSSELERLRARNAELEAQLAEGGAGRRSASSDPIDRRDLASDVWRCPACHHEAEHRHDSGCAARKDGTRCGCTYAIGGVSQ